MPESTVLLKSVSVANLAAGIDAPASVATVTINRASKSNALDPQTMQAFVDAIRQAQEDTSLRALIVTGAGERAFVGGADISVMGALDQDSAKTFISSVAACCDAVRQCPVPVIARVNGVAFGAGLELAASCDLRVAADSAQMGMPEVKLGIPSVVQAAVLPQLVGWGRTRQLLLLGDVYSASDAYDWGLYERVVPQAQLDGAVDEWVQSLLANGPAAVRAQKSLISHWEEASLDQAVRDSIETFAASWHHDEPQRMMQAWVENRVKAKKLPSS